MAFFQSKKRATSQEELLANNNKRKKNMPPFHVNVEDDFSASREGFMITIHGKPIPKKRYNV